MAKLLESEQYSSTKGKIDGGENIGTDSFLLEWQ
jgi:hypothetical protein